MTERSDVYCTNCGRTFIAEMDMALDGNHEITCPHCEHVHYRVVRAGVVTAERWASSSGPTFIATTIRAQVTTASTFTTTLSWSSWVNSTGSTLS